MEIEVTSGSKGGGVDVEHGMSANDEGGAYLVWEELNVVVPNFGINGESKRLLQCLNGYAEPGRIMAIMGPSGSGKSTLLDTLAGLIFSLCSYIYHSCFLHVCRSLLGFITYSVVIVL